LQLVPIRRAMWKEMRFETKHRHTVTSMPPDM
jgi:hypothetical protein